MLSPALIALSESTDAAEKERVRKAAAELTQRRLVDVEVPVAARFDAIRMPSSAIGRLEVGDVVHLGHRTSRPLSVVSASTTFAKAVPGAAGRTLAVLIVDPT
jgi:flagellar motor switch protein FliM